MVLQHLAALVPVVTLSHGARPDAPRHPSDHGVFRVHAVGKEKAQVGCEIIDIHTPRKIVLDDGEAIGQRECQLADRVRAGFSNVVTGNRHRVEVAHVVLHEILLDVAHHAHREFSRENTGVLRLVLFEDVGLHRTAHHAQRLGLDARIGFRIDYLVAGDAQQPQAQSFVATRQIAMVFRLALLEVRPDLLVGSVPATGFIQVFLDLLIDGRVHEIRQDHGRRTVDGHGYRGRWRAQVEARIQLLEVIQRGDGHTRIADLAVDIGPRVRVFSVEGHRVEGGRQPGRRVTLSQVVESPVGALRRALAGEHTDRVLLGAPVGVNARRVGIAARQILPHQETQQFAPVGIPGHADLGNLQMAQGLAEIIAGDLAVTHGIAVLLGAQALFSLRPLPEQFQGICREFGQRRVVSLTQNPERCFAGAVGLAAGKSVRWISLEGGG